MGMCGAGLAKSLGGAPGDGVMVGRHVDAGGVLASGAPGVTLMALAKPELRMGVAPDTGRALSPGERVTAEVGGRSYPATVRSIVPEVNPVTRTVDVLFDLDGPETPEVGQTATISLVRTRAQAGYWLPRGALSEGARGLWSVLIVNGTEGEPRAAREVVRIIHTEADRVFVEGSLADGVQVIAEGTHRIAPGQPIAPQNTVAQVAE